MAVAVWAGSCMWAVTSLSTHAEMRPEGLWNVDSRQKLDLLRQMQELWNFFVLVFNNTMMGKITAVTPNGVHCLLSVMCYLIRQMGGTSGGLGFPMAWLASLICHITGHLTAFRTSILVRPICVVFKRINLSTEILM